MNSLVPCFLGQAHIQGFFLSLFMKKVDLSTPEIGNKPKSSIPKLSYQGKSISFIA
jgi:hypothetical protein